MSSDTEYNDDTLLCTQQQHTLATIPEPDRGNESIQDLIRLTSVHDLEVYIGSKYATSESASFDLAAALYYIHRNELWALDGDHSSFEEFVTAAIPATEEVKKSTAYSMIRAYDVCIEIAEEAGSDGGDVTTWDVWVEFGKTKLSTVADKDPEIRAALIDAVRLGSSKRQLEDLKRELKSTYLLPDGSADSDDDDVMDADVVDDGLEELPDNGLEADPEPDADSDHDTAIEFGPDDNPLVTVHGTVQEGVYITLRPLDLEGEFDTLKGMELDQAMERAFFEYTLGKVRLAFTVEVRDGKLIGGALQFNEVARK
jgi:hypothetical protein